MSTSDFSWGKGGRCVRMTNYHPRNAERQENRGLNLPGTPWATSACCGRPLPFFTKWHRNIYICISACWVSRITRDASISGCGRFWHFLFTSVTTVSQTQSTQRRAAGWLMNWKRVMFFSAGNEKNHEKLSTDNAPIRYLKLVPTKRNSEIVSFRAIVLGGPHSFF